MKEKSYAFVKQHVNEPINIDYVCVFCSPSFIRIFKSNLHNINVCFARNFPIPLRDYIMHISGLDTLCVCF